MRRIFLGLAIPAVALFAGCRGTVEDTDPVFDTTPARRTEVEAYLESHYKSIPLTVSRDRTRYYAEIEIDGKSGRLLVDSGATVSVLFEQSLPRFGLAATGFQGRTYSGVGGDVRSGWTKYSSFLIGDKISVEPGAFHIVKPGMPADADGLLGNDILRNLRAVVDFKNGRLWFLDATTHLPEGLDAVAKHAGMKTAELREMLGAAFINVRLSGDTYQCIVDTGAAEWLLTETVADDLGLPKTKMASPAHGVGQDAVDQYAVTLPKRAVIGDRFTLERCRVLVAEHGESIPIYNYGGLFGAAPLADNRALLDIGNHRLYFETQRLRSRHRYDEPAKAR